MIELQKKIVSWANERNLVRGTTAINQFAKLVSEAGEISEAVINDKYLDIKDGIGDCFVVLCIISEILSIGDFFIDVVKSVPELKSQLSDTSKLETKAVPVFGLYVSIGDLGDAILKNEDPRKHIESSINFLSDIAYTCGFTLQKCVAAAYNEIKDRKGVMYNGTFVKSSDSRYHDILKEIGIQNGQ